MPPGKITQKKRIDFQDLMLYRVHEILLVASPYDAFILEEDGKLTEQILHEYIGMNFNYAPRVWQANSAKAALEMLSKRKLDIVIVMMRIADMNCLHLMNLRLNNYRRKLFRIQWIVCLYGQGMQMYFPLSLNR